MTVPTKRQKQLLRQLGQKSFDGLTKESASTLIDKLLTAERESRKKFPCPYCKKQFGPRPRHTRKCPSCGQRIIALCGTLYTEAQADKRKQKDWLQESRADIRRIVKSEWREERSFRKEFEEVHTSGYEIYVGPNCTASQHLDGKFISF